VLSAAQAGTLGRERARLAEEGGVPHWSTGLPTIDRAATEIDLERIRQVQERAERTGRTNAAITPPAASSPTGFRPRTPSDPISEDANIPSYLFDPPPSWSLFNDPTTGRTRQRS
jgi:hypothetical protein